MAHIPLASLFSEKVIPSIVEPAEGPFASLIPSSVAEALGSQPNSTVWSQHNNPAIATDSSLSRLYSTVDVSEAQARCCTSDFPGAVIASSDDSDDGGRDEINDNSSSASKRTKGHIAVTSCRSCLCDAPLCSTCASVCHQGHSLGPVFSARRHRSPRSKGILECACGSVGAACVARPSSEVIDTCTRAHNEILDAFDTARAVVGGHDNSLSAISLLRAAAASVSVGGWLPAGTQVRSVSLHVSEAFAALITPMQPLLEHLSYGTTAATTRTCLRGSNLRQTYRALVAHDSYHFDGIVTNFSHMGSYGSFSNGCVRPSSLVLTTSISQTRRFLHENKAGNLIMAAEAAGFNLVSLSHHMLAQKQALFSQMPSDAETTQRKVKKVSNALEKAIIGARKVAISSTLCTSEVMGAAGAASRVIATELLARDSRVSSTARRRSIAALGGLASLLRSCSGTDPELNAQALAQVARAAIVAGLCVPENEHVNGSQGSFDCESVTEARQAQYPAPTAPISLSMGSSCGYIPVSSTLPLTLPLTAAVASVPAAPTELSSYDDLRFLSHGQRTTILTCMPEKTAPSAHHMPPLSRLAGLPETEPLSTAPLPMNKSTSQLWSESSAQHQFNHDEESGCVASDMEIALRAASVVASAATAPQASEAAMAAAQQQLPRTGQVFAHQCDFTSDAHQPEEKKFHRRWADPLPLSTHVDLSHLSFSLLCPQAPSLPPLDSIGWEQQCPASGQWLPLPTAAANAVERAWRADCPVVTIPEPCFRVRLHEKQRQGQCRQHEMHERNAPSSNAGDDGTIDSQVIGASDAAVSDAGGWSPAVARRSIFGDGAGMTEPTVSELAVSAVRVETQAVQDLVSSDGARVARGISDSSNESGFGGSANALERSSLTRPLLAASVLPEQNASDSRVEGSIDYNHEQSARNNERDGNERRSPMLELSLSAQTRMVAPSGVATGLSPASDPSIGAMQVLSEAGSVFQISRVPPDPAATDTVHTNRERERSRVLEGSDSRDDSCFSSNIFCSSSDEDDSSAERHVCLRCMRLLSSPDPPLCASNLSPLPDSCTRGIGSRFCTGALLRRLPPAAQRTQPRRSVAVCAVTGEIYVLGADIGLLRLSPHPMTSCQSRPTLADQGSECRVLMQREDLSLLGDGSHITIAQLPLPRPSSHGGTSTVRAVLVRSPLMPGRALVAVDAETLKTMPFRVLLQAPATSQREEEKIAGQNTDHATNTDENSAELHLRSEPTFLKVHLRPRPASAIFEPLATTEMDDPGTAGVETPASAAAMIAACTPALAASESAEKAAAASAAIGALVPPPFTVEIAPPRKLTTCGHDRNSGNEQDASQSWELQCRGQCGELRWQQLELPTATLAWISHKVAGWGDPLFTPTRSFVSLPATLLTPNDTPSALPLCARSEAWLCIEQSGLWLRVLETRVQVESAGEKYGIERSQEDQCHSGPQYFCDHEKKPQDPPSPPVWVSFRLRLVPTMAARALCLPLWAQPRAAGGWDIISAERLGGDTFASRYCISAAPPLWMSSPVRAVVTTQQSSTPMQQDSHLQKLQGKADPASEVWRLPSLYSPLTHPTMPAWPGLTAALSAAWPIMKGPVFQRNSNTHNQFPTSALLSPLDARSHTHGREQSSLFGVSTTTAEASEVVAENTLAALTVNASYLQPSRLWQHTLCLPALEMGERCPLPLPMRAGDCFFLTRACSCGGDRGSVVTLSPLAKARVPAMPGGKIAIGLPSNIADYTTHTPEHASTNGEEAGPASREFAAVCLSCDSIETGVLVAPNATGSIAAAAGSSGDIGAASAISINIDTGSVTLVPLLQRAHPSQPLAKLADALTTAVAGANSSDIGSSIEAAISLVETVASASLLAYKAVSVLRPAATLIAAAQRGYVRAARASTASIESPLEAIGADGQPLRQRLGSAISLGIAAVQVASEKGVPSRVIVEVRESWAWVWAETFEAVYPSWGDRVNALDAAATAITASSAVISDMWTHCLNQLSCKLSAAFMGGSMVGLAPVTAEVPTQEQLQRLSALAVSERQTIGRTSGWTLCNALLWSFAWAQMHTQALRSGRAVTETGHATALAHAISAAFTSIPPPCDSKITLPPYMRACIDIASLSLTALAASPATGPMSASAVVLAALPWVVACTANVQRGAADEELSPGEKLSRDLCVFLEHDMPFLTSSPTPTLTPEAISLVSQAFFLWAPSGVLTEAAHARGLDRLRVPVRGCVGGAQGSAVHMGAAAEFRALVGCRPLPPWASEAARACEKRHLQQRCGQLGPQVLAPLETVAELGDALAYAAAEAHAGHVAASRLLDTLCATAATAAATCGGYSCRQRWGVRVRTGLRRMLHSIVSPVSQMPTLEAQAETQASWMPSEAVTVVNRLQKWESAHDRPENEAFLLGLLLGESDLPTAVDVADAKKVEMGATVAERLLRMGVDASTIIKTVADALFAEPAASEPPQPRDAVCSSSEGSLPHPLAAALRAGIAVASLLHGALARLGGRSKDCSALSGAERAAAAVAIKFGSSSPVIVREARQWLAGQRDLLSIATGGSTPIPVTNGAKGPLPAWLRSLAQTVFEAVRQPALASAATASLEAAEHHNRHTPIGSSVVGATPRGSIARSRPAAAARASFASPLANAGPSFVAAAAIAEISSAEAAASPGHLSEAHGTRLQLPPTVPRPSSRDSTHAHPRTTSLSQRAAESGIRLASHGSAETPRQQHEDASAVQAAAALAEKAAWDAASKKARLWQNVALELLTVSFSAASGEGERRESFRHEHTKKQPLSQQGNGVSWIMRRISAFAAISAADISPAVSSVCSGSRLHALAGSSGIISGLLHAARHQSAPLLIHTAALTALSRVLRTTATTASIEAALSTLQPVLSVLPPCGAAGGESFRDAAAAAGGAFRAAAREIRATLKQITASVAVHAQGSVSGFNEPLQRIHVLLRTLSLPLPPASARAAVTGSGVLSALAEAADTLWSLSSSARTDRFQRSALRTVGLAVVERTSVLVYAALAAHTLAHRESTVADKLNTPSIDPQLVANSPTVVFPTNAEASNAGDFVTAAGSVPTAVANALVSPLLSVTCAALDTLSHPLMLAVEAKTIANTAIAGAAVLSIAATAAARDTEAAAVWRRGEVVQRLVQIAQRLLRSIATTVGEFARDSDNSCGDSNTDAQMHLPTEVVQALTALLTQSLPLLAASDMLSTAVTAIWKAYVRLSRLIYQPLTALAGVCGVAKANGGKMGDNISSCPSPYGPAPSTESLVPSLRSLRRLLLSLTASLKPAGDVLVSLCVRSLKSQSPLSRLNAPVVTSSNKPSSTSVSRFIGAVALIGGFELSPAAAAHTTPFSAAAEADVAPYMPPIDVAIGDTVYVNIGPAFPFSPHAATAPWEGPAAHDPAAPLASTGLAHPLPLPNARAHGRGPAGPSYATAAGAFGPVAAASVVGVGRGGIRVRICSGGADAPLPTAIVAVTVPGSSAGSKDVASRRGAVRLGVAPDVPALLLPVLSEDNDFTASDSGSSDRSPACESADEWFDGWQLDQGRGGPSKEDEDDDTTRWLPLSSLHWQPLHPLTVVLAHAVGSMLAVSRGLDESPTEALLHAMRDRALALCTSTSTTSAENGMEKDHEQRLSRAIVTPSRLRLLGAALTAAATVAEPATRAVCATPAALPPAAVCAVADGRPTMLAQSQAAAVRVLAAMSAFASDAAAIAAAGVGPTECLWPLSSVLEAHSYRTAGLRALSVAVGSQYAAAAPVADGLCDQQLDRALRLGQKLGQWQDTGSSLASPAAAASPETLFSPSGRQYSGARSGTGAASSAAAAQARRGVRRRRERRGRRSSSSSSSRSSSVSDSDTPAPSVGEDSSNDEASRHRQSSTRTNRRSSFRNPVAAAAADSRVASMTLLRHADDDGSYAPRPPVLLALGEIAALGFPARAGQRALAAAGGDGDVAMRMLMTGEISEIAASSSSSDTAYDDTSDSGDDWADDMDSVGPSRSRARARAYTRSLGNRWSRGPEARAVRRSEAGAPRCWLRLLHALGAGADVVRHRRQQRWLQARQGRVNQYSAEGYEHWVAELSKKGEVYGENDGKKHLNRGDPDAEMRDNAICAARRRQKKAYGLMQQVKGTSLKEGEAITVDELLAREAAALLAVPPSVAAHAACARVTCIAAPTAPPAFAGSSSEEDGEDEDGYLGYGARRQLLRQPLPLRRRSGWEMGTAEAVAPTSVPTTAHEKGAGPKRGWSSDETDEVPPPSQRHSPMPRQPIRRDMWGTHAWHAGARVLLRPTALLALLELRRTQARSSETGTKQQGKQQGASGEATQAAVHPTVIVSSPGARPVAPAAPIKSGRGLSLARPRWPAPSPAALAAFGAASTVPLPRPAPLPPQPAAERAVEPGVATVSVPAVQRALLAAAATPAGSGTVVAVDRGRARVCVAIDTPYTGVSTQSLVWLPMRTLVPTTAQPPPAQAASAAAAGGARVGPASLLRTAFAAARAHTRLGGPVSPLMHVAIALAEGAERPEAEALAATASHVTAAVAAVAAYASECADVAVGETGTRIKRLLASEASTTALVGAVGPRNTLLLPSLCPPSAVSATTAAIGEPLCTHTALTDAAASAVATAALELRVPRAAPTADGQSSEKSADSSNGLALAALEHTRVSALAELDALCVYASGLAAPSDVSARPPPRPLERQWEAQGTRIPTAPQPSSLPPSPPPTEQEQEQQQQQQRQRLPDMPTMPFDFAANASSDASHAYRYLFPSTLTRVSWPQLPIQSDVPVEWLSAAHGQRLHPGKDLIQRAARVAAAARNPKLTPGVEYDGQEISGEFTRAEAAMLTLDFPLIGESTHSMPNRRRSSCTSTRNPVKDPPLPKWEGRWMWFAAHPAFRSLFSIRFYADHACTRLIACLPRHSALPAPLLLPSPCFIRTGPVLPSLLFDAAAAAEFQKDPELVYIGPADTPAIARAAGAAAAAVGARARLLRGGVRSSAAAAAVRAVEGEITAFLGLFAAISARTYLATGPVSVQSFFRKGMKPASRILQLSPSPLLHLRALALRTCTLLACSLTTAAPRRALVGAGSMRGELTSLTLHALGSLAAEEGALRAVEEAEWGAQSLRFAIDPREVEEQEPLQLVNESDGCSTSSEGESCDDSHEDAKNDEKNDRSGSKPRQRVSQVSAAPPAVRLCNPAQLLRRWRRAPYTAHCAAPQPPRGQGSGNSGRLGVVLQWPGPYSQMTKELLGFAAAAWRMTRTAANAEAPALEFADGTRTGATGKALAAVFPAARSCDDPREVGTGAAYSGSSLVSALSTAAQQEDQSTPFVRRTICKMPLVKTAARSLSKALSTSLADAPPSAVAAAYTRACPFGPLVAVVARANDAVLGPPPFGPEWPGAGSGADCGAAARARGEEGECALVSAADGCALELVDTSPWGAIAAAVAAADTARGKGSTGCQVQLYSLLPAAARARATDAALQLWTTPLWSTPAPAVPLRLPNTLASPLSARNSRNIPDAFTQLSRAVARLPPRLLRSPPGEIPWDTRLLGVAYTGAVGMPGTFRHAMGEAARALARAAGLDTAGVDAAGRGARGQEPKGALIKTPNALTDVGEGRDLLLLPPHARGATALAAARALGILLGIAARARTPLEVDLAPAVWRGLLGQEASPRGDGLPAGNLGEYDQSACLSLLALSASVDDGQQPLSEAAAAAAADSLEALGVDGWSTPSSSPGYAVPLALGLEHVPPYAAVADGSTASPAVAVAAVSQYTALAHRSRAQAAEASAALAALRSGFLVSMPAQALRAQSWAQLRSRACGDRRLDFSRLRRRTSYRPTCFGEGSPVVRWLWRALDEMGEEGRVAFLRFVWARSRLPGKGEGGDSSSDSDEDGEGSSTTPASIRPGGYQGNGWKMLVNVIALVPLSLEQGVAQSPSLAQLPQPQPQPQAQAQAQHGRAPSAASAAGSSSMDSNLLVSPVLRAPAPTAASQRAGQAVEASEEDHKEDMFVFALPTAETCFFCLNLPEYPSYEVLKAKLELAIRGCDTLMA